MSRARRFGILHPLEVEYQEHDRDIPENQVLLSALLILVDALQALGSRHWSRLAGAVPAFAGVTPLVTGAGMPSVHLSRLTEQYGRARTLADLILAGSGLTEVSGTHAGRGMLFPMWAVFEQFVARVLSRELQDQSVTPQFSTLLLVGSGEPIGSGPTS